MMPLHVIGRSIGGYRPQASSIRSIHPPKVESLQLLASAAEWTTRDLMMIDGGIKSPTRRRAIHGDKEAPLHGLRTANIQRRFII